MGEISPLQGGPGGRFGLHFGRSQGSFWLSFRCLVLKMRKSQNLQTVHTKTLIFRVPEAARGTFFEAKIVRKTSWEPRARRSTLRASKNRSPSALGEPPGSKKIFGNFQKRPRRVFRPCFTQMGSPRGLPEEPPGRSRGLGPKAPPEAPGGAPGAIFQPPEHHFRTISNQFFSCFCYLWGLRFEVWRLRFLLSCRRL